MDANNGKLKKKAKVTSSFKQKTQESAMMNEKRFVIEDSDNEDSEIERYFIDKIQCYFDDFEEERQNFKLQIEKLECELESSRNSQLDLLVKLRNLNKQTNYQDVKINFYKTQIRKYENNK